jgi:hypothetical protein
VLVVYAILGILFIIMLVAGAVGLKKLLRFKRKVIQKLKNIKSEHDYSNRVDFLWKRELHRINEETHQKIKERLKDPNQKLNVVFLVSQKSKWNSDSLFEELKKEKRVQVSIAVEECEVASSGYLSKERAERLRHENYEFFKKIDQNAVSLFSPELDESYRKMEALKPDIIFYQQPWGKMGDYPKRMIGQSLPAYMHYSYMLTANHSMHYERPYFHYYLWKYFTQTEGHKSLHLTHDPLALEKLIVLGYPKLDVYFEEREIDFKKLWKQPDPELKRVIYAPHHSIGKNNLQLSTFESNHKYFVELAKKNPKIQWIFKPHPTLEKRVVEKDLMSEKDYQAYVSEWASLPNAKVYDSGDYFDVFRASDALITDCGSFLAEYLPTKKPILHLMRKDSVGYNMVGKDIVRNYYQAYQVEEIEKLVNRVILQGDDYLYEERMKALEHLMPNQEKSGTLIKNHLMKEFALS